MLCGSNVCFMYVDSKGDSVAGALWLQRLFFCFMWIYVDSKGDVKAFFGLRFGRFSARVQMVFGSFCICSVQMVFA